MNLSKDQIQQNASVSHHKHFMKAVGCIQYIQYITAVTRPDMPRMPWPGTWPVVQRDTRWLSSML